MPRQGKSIVWQLTIEAFSLAGRIANLSLSQGNALGYELVGLSARIDLMFFTG